MQITLNEEEIREAVDTYVRSQITIEPSQKVDIDFTAGRGGNGLSATLQVSAVKSKVTNTKMGYSTRNLQSLDIGEPRLADGNPSATAVGPNDAEEDVPDQETPAQEAAREDAEDEKPKSKPGPKPKTNPFLKTVSAEDDGETDATPPTPKSIFSRAE